MELNEAIEKSTNLVTQAGELIIVDRPTYDKGADFIKSIKNMLDEIGKVFDPMVKKAYDAWKENIAQKDKFIKPLDEIKKRLSSAMTTWYDGELAKDAAEKKRLEKIEALRVAEEQKKEEDKRLAAAQKLQDAGLGKMADAVMSAPVVVAPVRVYTPEPPKAAGISYRTNYAAEVVDFPALLKAIVDGKASMIFIQACQSELDKQARFDKEKFNVPGVKLVTTKTQINRL